MPKLKKEDIIMQLAGLGVKFNPTASYGELRTLLKEQESTQEKLDPLTKAEAETPVVEEPKRMTMESEGIGNKQSDAIEKEVEEAKQSLNPFATFENKAPLTGKAHEMRKALMSQPRVPVMIPLGAEEKIGATHQVTLNGYTLFIRKGQIVDVPIQVAKTLKEKTDHQLNVREHPLRVGSGDPRDIKLQKFD
jgi:hypothetical protein